MILPCPKCGSSVETQGSSATCAACGATFVAGEVKTTPDASPPADPHVNSIIGGCRLLERVGAGGMGVVYKAEQISLGRIVAIKLLPEALRQDPQIRDRFQREIAILASLNHPNIVNILDGGISDQGAYFVMEYVDGISLRRIMTTARVKSEEALRIIPQLCDALEYAHGRGVVHRDIKPENILIDKGGRVRLLDFGLSRIAKADEPGLLTRPTQVLGTFEYMAPEQREASRGVDHRADLYSLGVVLYEMLTGELPIGRFDPPSQRNLQIDVRLDEVVLHALEKSPDRRYQKASEIKGEVERISATPPPFVSTARSGAAAPSAQPAPSAQAAPLTQPPPTPSSTPTPPPPGSSAGAPPVAGIPLTAAGAPGFQPPPLTSAWHGPSQLPTVLGWLSFGVLVLAGLDSGSWAAMLMSGFLLVYAYRKLESAPCKVNQWIVWICLTIMAVVACGYGRPRYDFAGLRFDDNPPFVNTKPWISALLLMPLFVYLTDRFRPQFANSRFAIFWLVLGIVGIAGVESGSILFTLIAGGAILLGLHLFTGQGAPMGQGSSAGVQPGLTGAQSSMTGAGSSYAAYAAPPPPSYPPPAPSFAPPRPVDSPSSYAGSAFAGPIPVSKWALWAFWLALLGTAIVVATFVVALTFLG